MNLGEDISLIKVFFSTIIVRTYYDTYSMLIELGRIYCPIKLCRKYLTM